MAFSSAKPTRNSTTLSVAMTLLFTGTSFAIAHPGHSHRGGCLVTHLDGGSDAFLSVRSGPSTQHAEVARVRSGDVLFINTHNCQNGWCRADAATINGRANDIDGWFPTAPCDMF